jgi:putative ABC transport system permease protein
MALGIAAATVLASVAYGVLLKPLPWAQSNRLVRIYETRQGSTRTLGPLMTNATYHAWREAPTSIDALAGWSMQTAVLTGSGDPERVRIARVTPNLFGMLGASAAAGRLFSDRDARAGGPPLVILSYGFWQERFGGADPLGRTIRLDAKTYGVIGVMPQPFSFPDRETRLWIPFDVPPPSAPGSGRVSVSLFNGLARLRSGVTPAQAAAEGAARARTTPPLGPVGIAVFGSNGPAEITTVPLLDAITGEVRPAILVLFIGVMLLLATAVANVASVQLARAAARRREMAIRAAVGAAAGRLARQTLVENLLVGAAGGIAGLLLAAWMQHALPSVLPADFPRAADITLDTRVEIFAAMTSLAAALAFGLVPALQARRTDLVASLAEDGSAPAGGSGRSRTARARALIMAGQVAVACVLLLGAALLARSFHRLLNADVGFDRGNALAARVSLSDGLYTPVARLQALERIAARLEQMPGVRHVAYSSNIPFSAGEILASFPLRTPDRGTIQIQTAMRIVSRDYFAALGERVVEGRAFTNADTPGSAKAVVVNREFARRYLGRRAIGFRIFTANVPGAASVATDHGDTTIVGVVEDAARQQVTDAPQPELFQLSIQQQPAMQADDVELLVRTSVDPRSLVSTLRAIASSEAPDAPLSAVTTLEDRVSSTLARPQLYAVLLGAFAAFALAIAAVGLFGVLSYSVAQRSREIAVRAALGAAPRDLIALVVGQCMRITAAGIAVGLVVSAWLSRVVARLLYGVTTHDAASIGAVTALLLAVAALAAFLPARRAATVDPVQVLRG